MSGGDPSLAVQTAILAQLNADPRVASVVTAIFDDFRSTVKATPPYLVLGPDQSVPEFGDEYDGSLVHATLHVWSQTPGFAEAKGIGSAVRAALDLADLAIDGFHCVGCRFQEAQYFNDPDQISKHGVLSFTVTVEPV